MYKAYICTMYYAGKGIGGGKFEVFFKTMPSFCKMQNLIEREGKTNERENVITLGSL